MSGLGQDTDNLAGGARMGRWGWGNSKPDGLIHWSVRDAVWGNMGHKEQRVDGCETQAKSKSDGRVMPIHTQNPYGEIGTG